MRDVETLLEALPYIREFHGRTVVIKYGGAAMEDPALREEFARDVVLLKYVGLDPVIVHGGGPEITSYMKKLDMPVEFVGGLRVSDAETVEIAKMVLVGKVNKDIVMRLNRHGQQAVGAVVYDSAPLALDIYIEDVQVCSRGSAVPHDADALALAVRGPEVEYTVGLPGEGAEAEVFFSDLSHEYVRINAEYTT